jgi:cytochrome c553
MKLAGCLFVVLLAALPQRLYAQRAIESERRAPPAVQACIGCHGNQGQGNPEAGGPRLAGQSALYLLKQLNSYANGSRRNRVMEPIARGLPPELRGDVARHYASIDAPFDNRSRSRRPPRRGEVLATQGDDRLGVQACRNCHGPGGVGEPPNIPYIAGLDANYLSAALKAWKEGTRTNDAGQQMFTVVTPLSAEDIDAVAQYYASLRPPKPAPPNLVQAPSPRKEPVAEPTTAAPVNQSGKRVGIEQAAPMKGGTQGAGGTDASKGSLGGRGKDASEIGTPDSPPKTDGSKARPTTSRTEWPQLSDADTSRVSSRELVRGGDPARGRAIIAAGVHGCAACHTIPGIPSPNGIVGPRLDGLSRRGFIAGQLPNRPDVLVAFLQDPPALVPQTGMPNVGLTGEQARDIAAYLYSLETSSAP